MVSLNHANHITGLRALAILTVIAFHTNPNLFPNPNPNLSKDLDLHFHERQIDCLACP